MSESLAQPSPIMAPAEGRLKPGRIGVLGMILMVVAATAPLTAVASNFAISVAIGAGEGTLGLLVIVAAVFTVFTAGYVVLSRHVVSAGAFYEFIAFGLGRRIGSGAAFIAALLYNLGAAAMALISGFFIGNAATNYLSWTLPWWTYALLTLAVAGVLGHLGVGFAARFTSVTSIVQFLILVAFCVAVLLKNPSGYRFDGFTPSAMFSGGYSLSLIFLVLCFAGYETAAIYGEESHSAPKKIKQATYGALGLLAVVFLASVWSVLAAFDDPIAVAQADPGGFIFTATDLYLGTWSGPLLNVLVAFSFFSATISFSCMAHRYLFALGRAHLLPSKLANPHPTRDTPVVANWVQISVSVILIGLLALQGADPFLVIQPAIAGVTSTSLLLLMAACSVSVVIAARRGKVTGSPWSTIIAPLISATAWITCIVLFLLNFESVTGSSSAWVKAALALPLLAFLAGYAVYARRRASGDSPIIDAA